MDVIKTPREKKPEDPIEPRLNITMDSKGFQSMIFSCLDVTKSPIYLQYHPELTQDIEKRIAKELIGQIELIKPAELLPMSEVYRTRVQRDLLSQYECYKAVNFPGDSRLLSEGREKVLV